MAEAAGNGSASALPGAVFEGYVRVAEAGRLGMIALKGDLASEPVAAALAAAGLAVPGRRRLAGAGARAAAWFAPDEVLAMLPEAEVAETLAAMRAAAAGAHVTLADVTDARAVFELSGDAVREVLAKLSPADLHPDALPPGEVRRTRSAQVPVAFWLPEEGRARLVCFRSVAGYVFDILSLSAAPGGEAGVLSPR